MTKQSFKDFVTEKTAEASQKAMDWAQVKAEWIKKVGDLEDSMTLWLGSYKDSVQTGREGIEISEEMIGSYQAPLLVIAIGNNVVRIEPVARFIFGGAGRVDIKGPKGIARLVLAPKDSDGPRGQVEGRSSGQASRLGTREAISEWVWKLASPPPAIKYADLTEESFLDALMAVVNG